MKDLRPLSKAEMKNVTGGVAEPPKFWGTDCVQNGEGRFEYGVTNDDGGVEGTLDYVCDYTCTYYVLGVAVGSAKPLIGVSCEFPA